jgi:hypothetical protein
MLFQDPDAISHYISAGCKHGAAFLFESHPLYRPSTKVKFIQHRYSQRLSTFYAARADAIVAAADRKTDLGSWGPAFLPDTIDFGRQPKPPAQYVVDGVEAYFQGRKRRKNRVENSEGSEE